jgi:hypothetical protein
MTAARTRQSPAKAAGKSTAELTGQDEHHLPVDSKTMRRLHGLLTAHGIPTADKGRHDYLSAEVGRPITSASELTRTEAARLIAELEADDAPEVHTLTTRALRKLREPFKDEEVGKLPRSLCRNCSDSRNPGPDGKGTCGMHPNKGECRICGNYHNTQATMHIDFVGHADVTARLLEVDPTWTWTPMACDPNGFPLVDASGGLWINLTVCGVTRPGYGEGKSGQQVGGDQVKVAIGDALRNAAMRFGVALDLWAKGDREWAHEQKHGAEDMAPDQPPPPQEQPPTPWDGPTVDQSIARLIEIAGTQGTDLDGITAKFREQRGLATVDELVEVPPQVMAAFVQSVEAYAAAHPPVPAEAQA